MEYLLKKSQGVLNGIYQIKNTLNDKVYIGSAVGFRRRYASHLCLLKKKKHDNKRLQNFVNKYGIKTLSFEILEIVGDRADLIKREQFYIDSKNPFFNICRKAGSTLGQKPFEGRKHKKESIKKIKAALKAHYDNKPKKEKPKKKSQEEVLAIFIAFSRTPAERKRKSDAMKGHKYWQGRKHKEATKEKMKGSGNGRARKVRIAELKITFDTLRDASKFLNVGYPAVCNALRRGNKCKGYTLEYA